MKHTTSALASTIAMMRINISFGAIRSHRLPGFTL
jgi:hypothetical protein